MYVYWYLEQYALDVAENFVTALEEAIAYISRHPAAGSPRYASELGFSDLRFWKIKRYPYLAFYVECGDPIDVWRILHTQRDIPVWLLDPE